MNKVFAVALLAILTSGCATQNYVMSASDVPNATVTPDASKMQTFFVSGLGQEQEVNATEICQGKENIASVQTQSNILNIALGIISYGIYTPRQVRVYCK